MRAEKIRQQKKTIRRNTYWLLGISALLVINIYLLTYSSRINKNIWPPVPPIELPLNVKNSGIKIENNFQIIEKKLYAFELRFLFNEGDEVDRAKTRKLSGGAKVTDSFGRKTIPPYEKGVPLSLKLTLNKINKGNGEKLLLYQNIINTEEIGLSSWNYVHFNKELVSLSLEPGQYDIEVEPISISPELAKTIVNFLITFPYRGK